MAKGYSYDLRRKVMGSLEAGKTITDISKLFQISRKTVYRWLERKQESGDIKEKQGYQKGHSHKITDFNKFEDFMKSQDGKSLSDIAQAFPEMGSASTLSRTLRKLKLSYKKKYSAIPNGTKD